MSPAMWEAVFLNILIPELSRWLLRRGQGDLPLPTKDEILAHLNESADRYYEAGVAFLRSKGVEIA